MSSGEGTERRRWALVTGASRGIGRAVALDLAGRGWNLALGYLRREEDARAVAALAEAEGAEVILCPDNLIKVDERALAIERVRERTDRLDGLVHAAGLGAATPVLGGRPARWSMPWATHVEALLDLLHQADDLLGAGTAVVALSSLGAERVTPGYAPIGAAKGALETVVRYLAVDLAPRGIRVNCVRGGPVDTESLRSFPFFSDLEAESTRRPPGRLGRPEDIAPMVAFLLGPDAAWIQGQVIVADGGFSPGLTMRHYWVDHVSIVEPGVRATARKAVGWAEDHFADHFPGNPVLPGVYIIEGIAQAAGALLGRASDWADFALMVSVDRARFSEFVRPGDVVEYRIEVEERTAAMARVGAVATVGDRRVAQVRLSFQIRPLATMIPEPHRAAWIHTLGLLFDKDLGKDRLADA